MFTNSSIRIILLWFLTAISFLKCKALDFTGDKLIEVLNKHKSHSTTLSFVDFWLLDKNLQNIYGGIEIKVNNNTGLVDSIIIAGTGYKNFLACTSPLPYEVSLKDDITMIQAKTSVPPSKVSNIWTFDVGMCLMSVEINPEGKIRCIKYYSASVVASSSLPKKPNVIPANKIETRDQKVIPSVNKEKVEIKPTISRIENSGNTMSSAILQIFNSYRESGLNSIKRNQRSQSNFWNYKYTYYSSIKIPGEKFNMIYSFPFPYSQLDFVSVIQEGNVFDESFIKTYKQTENKLSESLTQEKGWYSVCIPNKESKTISDIEFRNEQTGSVILDYSKNPAGKHILYLRFLFFSN